MYLTPTRNEHFLSIHNHSWNSSTYHFKKFIIPRCAVVIGDDNRNDTPNIANSPCHDHEDIQARDLSLHFISQRQGGSMWCYFHKPQSQTKPFKPLYSRRREMLRGRSSPQGGSGTLTDSLPSYSREWRRWTGNKDNVDHRKTPGTILRSASWAADDRALLRWSLKNSRPRFTVR